MKINANLIRPGNVLDHEGKLWSVLKIQLIQPGKGGAFIQVEMRDVRSGNKTNVRWRTQDTVEKAMVDEAECTFLYADGDALTFMNSATFDQFTMARDQVGDAAQFLQEGMVVMVETIEGQPVSVTLPQTVTMDHRRGRPGGEGPDRVVELQAGDPGERHPRHGAAARRVGHPHRRQHRRRLLRRTRQGLMDCTAWTTSPIQTVIARLVRAIHLSSRQPPRPARGCPGQAGA